ncbi:Na+/H+ antiporter NhaC family protein [Litorimonas sp. RW-G-Af-16]|uniref:Na+/H+ antiporter NhaC family protein n=1 Tax=Litorimonas sp. RW-G-Af-16 TaxID=3241168 RepID=UPI00390CC7E2
MENIGLLSLVPPLLAIGLALLTRQVFLSLAAGLWIGFVILAGGNPVAGTFDAIDGFVDVFKDAGNTRIIIFTLVVGALIALIQRSGGVAGFVARLLSRLERMSDSAESRGQRKLVELLALGTGLLLFIESNISILTVGTLYRPVFDKLGIPREKLAYITDSGSAPSCVLIPFNAWGAFLMGLIAAEGLTNPFQQLVSATLFNFYPMLIIVILIFVILSGKDVGEMKTAERRARETGKLTRDGAQIMMADAASDVSAKDGVTPRAMNMIIPIMVMVLLMPVFLIMTGEGETWLSQMQDGSGSSSVLYATSFAVIAAMLLYKVQGIMGVRESFEQSLAGMSGMVPLAILMVLAFALGTLCKQLGTGQYVADVASSFISPGLVPALIFLIACFVAFSTGTSWGTFAIMFPIAVPLAIGMDTNVSLAMAAAIGGGVFGDHCSPTSDTSIITSMATANDHIDHIRTQLPYALIAGAVTTMIYLILGFIGA